MATSANDRIRRMSVASVYPHYVAKAEKKGRTRAEVDRIILWLTGYSADGLQAHLEAKTTFEAFFAEAPAMNPNRFLITGVICGYRVEEIEDPFMREVRHLDKMVDELARGKAMEKVLRAG
ncbi:DUF2200 domain-containing protein [Brevundimonas sp. BAL450]|jgi:hypothetical protein|uniref:DUF2200 domain-containing protein n=1 Tax=Brevundimonas abyssalis TAR-001 TaxID=1391729 RepID=A0A8E0TS27_9CAUL|nr:MULTISPECIES: DUF2200 domain-containing protein [Brevundimonas]MBG7613977.1 DUF2200 domain-containing protein [Brevundimonas sp. BAL450]GAD60278.1 hypothetical protein MBEBAB_2528 [Brevundimonas abyssalis TAR-001]